tara:strand:- start:2691 stop:3386 length:696 start_codon:yes stop_codon:yes gene_type:complete
VTGRTRGHAYAAAHEKPTLVIFDCDGVLVDTETIAGAMFSEYVRATGYSASHEECLVTFRGRSMKSAMEIVEADIGRTLPADWGERIEEDVQAIFRRSVDAIPHVYHVTKAIEATGIDRCVASSSVLEHIENSVEKIGLADHFSGNLFSATMVEKGKPAPDLFLHAAREMGHAPQVSVVIEDSLPGVQAGVAAGMRVFGYVGDEITDGRALAEAGATVFDDMRKLPTLMGL